MAGALSFPRVPWVYVTCPASRHVSWLSVRCRVFPSRSLGSHHVSGFTSRALVFPGAKAFRQVPCLSVHYLTFFRCPAFRSRSLGSHHVSGFTSRALAFSGAKAFRQVPCLSVTFPALCHVPWLSVTFPAVCHVPCFYSSVWLCVSCRHLSFHIFSMLTPIHEGVYTHRTDVCLFV